MDDVLEKMLRLAATGRFVIGGLRGIGVVNPTANEIESLMEGEEWSVVPHSIPGRTIPNIIILELAVPK